MVDILPERIRTLKDLEVHQGKVIYWMSRNQKNTSKSYKRSKRIYMNEKGCRRKFDVENHIGTINVVSDFTKAC